MKKRGISITILIITIIVMIIISGAVIINLKEDNSVEKADKVVFQQDIKEFSKALDLEMSSSLLEDESFDSYLINEVTYDNIKKYIPKFMEKYEDLLVIEHGELVYIGTDEDEKDWVNEIGVKVR